jgi:hypothetical protein
VSADCTRCSNDCPWGETLCEQCRDYEILHLLQRAERWRPPPILIFVLLVGSITIGVYMGEWLWWHHAAQVAHEQLCRSFPSPACRSVP